MSSNSVSWAGSLGEIDFLSRLYDLDSLPSSDSRFETARGDVIQHRINNLDWEDDWVFSDERLGLVSSDQNLLEFLAETLHPEVRRDPAEVSELRNRLNEVLKHDLYELRVARRVSGRPVFAPGRREPRKVTDQMIRSAIGQAVRHAFSAYKVANYCDSLGLPLPDEGSDVAPMASKAAYVEERIKRIAGVRLLDLARLVQDDCEDAELEDLLAEIDRGVAGGVAGKPKNLIFAANGPKPEIVLSDSVDNHIQITKNAEYCLVFDDPIDAASGVSWADLVAWWSREKEVPQNDAPRELYERLLLACSEPERVILRVYSHILKQRGPDLPALIPQVYLHFDPLTARQRLNASPSPLVRQRMDFLMILPQRQRVVLELDGKQHYADGDKASPLLYAEMMREDRRLRLSGYEVYRFGGQEFIDEDKAATAMEEFFMDLLRKHQLIE